MITKVILKIGKVITNKVFLYMITRYITYALQFALSLIIAFKLGPELFGIWSFILLIINFFNIVDLGIPNSTNVLMVQNKSAEDKINNYVLSSMILVSILCFFAFIFCWMAWLFDFSILAKYDIRNFLPALLIVVILSYFNKLFSAIYRVKNRLLEIAINQSIIPVFLLVTILFVKDNLLNVMVGAYVVGNVTSLFLFLIRRQIPFAGRFVWRDIRKVAMKGFWLFLYNGAFYLIMYSTSLCVSIYYEVNEYGRYNFAYTIAHAVILLVDSFTFIIFPKMIDRLQGSYTQAYKSIAYIRSNYMSIIYGLIFFSLPFFYFFSYYIPQYSNTSRALCLSALTLLPYANAFGLNTYLIAQNEERNLSQISLFCLLCNIIFSIVLTMVIHVDYDLVLFATLITYIIYTFLCARLSLKKMGMDYSFLNSINIAFPLDKTLPFIMAIFCVFVSFQFDNFLYLTIPFLLFILLNKEDMMMMLSTIRKVIDNPKVVDL